MKFRLDDEAGPEVQMAPLIDCVFLLLIFFLVATTLKKIEEELPVNLPTASAAVEVTRGDNDLELSIDEAGQFHIGKTPIDFDTLHERLREVGKQNRAEPGRDYKVRINVDEQTPSRYVVQVMDLCQFEGLNHVAIQTRQPIRYGSR